MLPVPGSVTWRPGRVSGEPQRTWRGDGSPARRPRRVPVAVAGRRSAWRWKMGLPLLVLIEDFREGGDLGDALPALRGDGVGAAAVVVSVGVYHEPVAVQPLEGPGDGAVARA